MCFVPRSGAEQVKLLGKDGRKLPTYPRLLLAHHVNHLDPTQDYTRSGYKLKTEHGLDPPLDGAMVLLKPIIQIGGRRALLITNGDASIFLTRPLSAIFLALAGFLICLALLPSLGRRREQVFQEA